LNVNDYFAANNQFYAVRSASIPVGATTRLQRDGVKIALAASINAVIAATNTMVKEP
jgi:hypothetical protein